MKTPIEELIEKYERGIAIHTRESNKESNSNIAKNRATYQLNLCEAIVSDLREIQSKFFHTKEDMRSLYYATQQNDFWVKYDGFGGKEGYYTKTFEDE
jgi:hypothetical protein